jgi:hypothetical protein
LGARPVPTSYYGNSSGPIACVLAAQDHHQTVYMLGFDLGPNQDQTFNNVYAGTEFYKAVGARPTYTGNWIAQITKIARDFPTVQFYRVQGKTTADIPELGRILNFHHCALDQFRDQFDC